MKPSAVVDRQETARIGFRREADLTVVSVGRSRLHGYGPLVAEEPPNSSLILELLMEAHVLCDQNLREGEGC